MVAPGSDLYKPFRFLIGAWGEGCEAHLSPTSHVIAGIGKDQDLATDDTDDTDEKRARSRRLPALNRVPHLFGINVLGVLHDFAVLEIPYVGKNGVHRAPGLLVSPKISAGHDDRFSGVIKLVHLGAVAVPLGGQAGEHVFPDLFHAVVCPGIGEAGGLSPLKPGRQRGLKVFGDLLSVAFVNALDCLQICFHKITLINICLLSH